MLEVAPEIKKLVPYVTGKPIEETQREYGIKKVIKLASNENPLGASPKVYQALKKAMKNLHLYPDGACFELKKAYCKNFGFKPEELVFGNGSDELMSLLLQAYCQPGDIVVSFQYSFVAFKIAAQAHCLDTFEIKNKENFQYDVDALTSFIKNDWTSKHKFIYLANPNNPTGALITHDQLTALVKAVSLRKDLILVIDEAYLEFVNSKDYGHAQDFLATCPNIVLLRTMSKAYGLAGLRIGVLIGNPQVIEPVAKVRTPFSVNGLAQVAAVAALNDVNHVKKSVKLAWAGVEYLTSELKKMGLKVYSTQGNFVLFDCGREVAEIFESLLKLGLIVRPLKNYGLTKLIRLSVGTKDQNKFAIQVLKKVLGAR